MALHLGKKPMADEFTMKILLGSLKNLDERSVPRFVKPLELKEKSMASTFNELCRTIARKRREQIEQGDEVNDEIFEASLALDLYIMTWFGVHCSDAIKDLDFVEFMNSAYEGAEDDE